MNQFVVRAAFSGKVIRVYQAYSSEIAISALGAGRFVPPFKIDRMTWIKPSFNWIMYRSGYATKPGQEFILGIDIIRNGFEWALEHAALSTFTPSIHSNEAEWRDSLAQNPVRVQWDPERDFRLNSVKEVRTIQIGLSGIAVRHYVNEWIVRIEDVSETARQIARSVQNNLVPSDLPHKSERPYPLNANVAKSLCPQCESS